MKAIVFDNAGTILKRVTALKDMSNNNIIYETNTIGMADKNDENIILVFQMPTHKLIQEKGKIIDYLKTSKQAYEISYSQKHYTKDDVIKALENDETNFEDIKDSAKSLINRYEIEICSGTAMIVNMKGKITHVYTAGGYLFEGTRELFQKLGTSGWSIYIASGDNQNSLNKISSILKVKKENVYHTCNIKCKEKVIKKLQKQYETVIMVGNHSNDKLALKQANIGILSTQQGETLSEDVIESADYIIDNIKKVMKIVEKEV